MIKLKLKKVRDFTEDERQQLNQLVEFQTNVYKVVDGDTINIKLPFLNFLTPMRFFGTNAPELNEEGGKVAQQYLQGRLLGKNIDVHLGEQKEEKWGRLLGRALSSGNWMDEEMIMLGFSTPFDRRDDGKFPSQEEAFEEGRIAKEWQM